MTIGLKPNKACDITSNGDTSPILETCDGNGNGKFARQIRNKQSKSRRKYAYSCNERRTKSCIPAFDTLNENHQNGIPNSLTCSNYKSAIELTSLRVHTPHPTWPLSRIEEQTLNPTKYFDKCLRELVLFRLGLGHSGNLRNQWGNMSYADLIAMAIVNSIWKRMSLGEICAWFVEYVPFFKDKSDPCRTWGWKNSIRHNLSLHDRFIRVPLIMTSSNMQPPHSTRYVWAVKSEPTEFSGFQLRDRQLIQTCGVSANLLRKRRKLQMSNVSNSEGNAVTEEFINREKRFRSLTPTICPAMHQQLSHKTGFAHKHLTAFLSESKTNQDNGNNSAFNFVTSESQSYHRNREAKNYVSKNRNCLYNILLAGITNNEVEKMHLHCARNSSHVLNRLLERRDDTTSATGSIADKHNPTFAHQHSITPTLSAINNNLNVKSVLFGDEGHHCKSKKQGISKILDSLTASGIRSSTLQYSDKNSQYRNYQIKHEPDARFVSTAVQTVDASGVKHVTLKHAFMETFAFSDKAVQTTHSFENFSSQSSDFTVCNGRSSQGLSEKNNSELYFSQSVPGIEHVSMQKILHHKPVVENGDIHQDMTNDRTSSDNSSDDHQIYRELKCALNLIRHLRQLPQDHRTNLYQSLVQFDLNNGLADDNNDPLDYSTARHRDGKQL